MKERSKKQAPKAEIAPELVALAKAGDQSAFTELYEQTNPMLYRSIRAMVHDEDLAWDILQDSYLRAFRSLDKLEADEAFLVWLRRIAVNETARQMSKRAPLPFTELENGEEESLPELPDMNEEHQPELALDRQETSRLVREILSELTEQQQLVVGMRYYEEMSVTEIAQLLQVAPGTVKAQLFKGRKKVETRVRALETQGVKLYGMSPIPFLVALLRRLEPTREAEKKGLAVLLSQLPAAASTVTALTAGQALLHSLTGRLLVGLLALALLGGGIATGGKLFKDAIARIGDFQFTDTQYLASSEDPYASSDIRVAVSETEPGESDTPRPPQPENDDPTEPSDSRNPSEPTEPSDSQNPSEPTEPTDAPNPSENPNPSEPGPTQPPTPGGPSTPSDPPSPSESQNPTDPTNPPVPPESDTPSPPPTTEPTEPITEHTEPITEHTEPATDPTEPPVELITGVCGADGNNLTWSLNPDTGEMMIEGSGRMMNYGTPPWSSYRSSIQKVTVSAGAETIGDYAFDGCFSLSSVTLPEGLTKISFRAFCGCTALTSISFPSSLTTLSYGAFKSTGLTSVNIPATLTTIAAGALSDCKNLDSITVAADNPKYCSVNGVLFNKDMSGLYQYPVHRAGSYRVPDGVNIIWSGAFDSCPGLIAISFPQSLNVIEGTFVGCSGLTSISLPRDIVRMDSIFEKCPSLRSFTVDEGGQGVLSSIDGVLFIVDRTNYIKPIPTLKRCPPARSGSYVVPDGWPIIGHYAFYQCTKLTAVTLPDGVTEIGSCGFYGCTALSSITIPASVTTIDFHAFDGCENLTIYAPAGSYAETYANNHNIPFVAVSP